MISVFFFALELPTGSASMTNTIRILVRWGTPFEIQPKLTPVPPYTPDSGVWDPEYYALGFARSMTSF
jgi:hypothetical protein